MGADPCSLGPRGLEGSWRRSGHRAATLG